MELLYVLIGGAMVIAGYALAKIDWKRREKPMTEIPPREQEEPKPEIPKSGIPIDEQLEDMQSYDPRKARKKGLSEG